MDGLTVVGSGCFRNSESDGFVVLFNSLCLLIASNKLHRIQANGSGIDSSVCPAIESQSVFEA